MKRYIGTAAGIAALVLKTNSALCGAEYPSSYDIVFTDIIQISVTKKITGKDYIDYIGNDRSNPNMTYPFPLCSIEDIYSLKYLNNKCGIAITNSDDGIPDKNKKICSNNEGCVKLRIDINILKDKNISDSIYYAIKYPCAITQNPDQFPSNISDAQIRSWDSTMKKRWEYMRCSQKNPVFGRNIIIKDNIIMFDFNRLSISW